MTGTDIQLLRHLNADHYIIPDSLLIIPGYAPGTNPLFPIPCWARFPY